MFSLAILTTAAFAATEITKAEFDNYVGGEKGAFIKFLAPW